MYKISFSTAKKEWYILVEEAFFIGLLETGYFNKNMILGDGQPNENMEDTIRQALGLPDKSVQSLTHENGTKYYADKIQG